MHYTIERHKAEVILPLSIVTWDKIVNTSLSLTPPHQGDPQFPDFRFFDDGTIRFYKAGDYVVKWRTTQMTGFSSDGRYFELWRKDFFNPEYTSWEDGEIPWVVVGDELAVETMKDSGMVPVRVLDSEVAYPPDPDAPVEEHPRTFTIALKNITEGSINLTAYSHLKASLLIFGVPHLEEPTLSQIDDLIAGLDTYEEACCIADLTPRIDRIVKMNGVGEPGDEPYEGRQEGQIADFSLMLQTFYDEFTSYYAPMPIGPSIPSLAPLLGLEVFVMVYGYVHKFWIAGSLAAGVAAATNEKIYVLRSSDYEPISHYTGDATVAPCMWRQGSDFGWFAIYFDNTGIYFLNPPEAALKEGGTFDFTESLILMT